MWLIAMKSESHCSSQPLFWLYEFHSIEAAVITYYLLFLSTMDLKSFAKLRMFKRMFVYGFDCARTQCRPFHSSNTNNSRTRRWHMLLHYISFGVRKRESTVRSRSLSSPLLGSCCGDFGPLGACAYRCRILLFINAINWWSRQWWRDTCHEQITKF